MPFVDDAMYGRVFLDYEEYEVLGTVEMQALARRKLAGFGYLINVTAVQTRLSHSVGSLHVLNEIIGNSKFPRVEQEQLRILRLAALTKDLGRTCFAPILRRRLSDEKLGIPSVHAVLKAILEGKSHGWWTERLGRSPGKPKFLSDVIRDKATRDGIIKSITPPKDPSNTGIMGLVEGSFDADQLDQFARDAASFGFHNANFDKALHSGFALEGTAKRLVLRNNPRVLSSVEDFLYARWYTYRHGYMHPSVIAAEAMLVEAVRLGLPSEKDRRSLFVLGDEELLGQLARGGSAANEKDATRVAQLASRLLARDLYKTVLSVNVASPEIREAYKDPQKLQKELDEHRVLVARHGQFVQVVEQDEATQVKGAAARPNARADFHVEGGVKLDAAIRWQKLDPNIRAFEQRYSNLDVMHVFSSETKMEKWGPVLRDALYALGLHLKSPVDLVAGDYEKRSSLPPVAFLASPVAPDDVREVSVAHDIARFLSTLRSIALDKNNAKHRASALRLMERLAAEREVSADSPSDRRKLSAALGVIRRVERECGVTLVYTTRGEARRGTYIMPERIKRSMLRRLAGEKDLGGIFSPLPPSSGRTARHPPS